MLDSNNVVSHQPLLLNGWNANGLDYLKKPRHVNSQKQVHLLSKNNTSVVFLLTVWISTINSEHKVTSWVQQMSLVQLQHSTMLWRICPANQLLQLNLLLASVFQFICFGDKSVLICVRSSRHIRCTCVT